jgi:hypothetical protein
MAAAAGGELGASAAVVDAGDEQLFDEGGQDIHIAQDIRFGLEESEDEPAPEEAAPAPKRQKTNQADWQRTVLPVAWPAFMDHHCGPQVPSDVKTELNLFDLWWRPLRTAMVGATNDYYFTVQRAAPSLRLDGFRLVTDTEMDLFLAIVIFMGLVELPSDVDYWRPPPYGQVFVQRLMSRNRFLQIKRCLSISNPDAAANTADKIAKVRKAQEIFNDVSARVYKCRQNLSLDEAQIQCAHRMARISFRAGKNKPLSDYIKTFSINEAGTSYCPKFLIDERDKRTTREYVLKLVEPLIGKEHVLYIDRFYTSIDTCLALMNLGLFTVGTMRTDRGVPKDLVDDVKRTPLEDGESRFRMAKTDDPLHPMSIVVWRDTAADGFYTLSNVHDPTKITTVDRRKKGVGFITKPAPQCVADYNTYMGFVDSMNHMKCSYKVQLQYHHRWYMGVVFYVLELSIINALVLFRQTGHPGVSHKSFREQLVDQLVARSGGASKRHSVSEPEELPERLSKAHIIKKTDRRGRCSHCVAQGIPDAKAHYKCGTCGVPLHTDCFYDYHVYLEK